MEVDIDEIQDHQIGETNSDEEDECTLGHVIEMMEEAWLNEKFAPEILPNKSEVTDILLEQISYMEKNLEKLESSDFRKSIYQLEIDRLRFLVTSYLRTRLEKIEIYAVAILKQEEYRMENNENPYLTAKELEFARNYQQALEHHFENVTNFQPGLFESVKESDLSKHIVEPNLHSFVFLKSKTEVEGVVIDDGGDDGDLVDLTTGSQLIISYHSVSNLVKNGDAHLI